MGQSGIPEMAPRKAIEIMQLRSTKPATPPRFIRDGMDVADIAGSQPRRWFKGQGRDNMNVGDVEGAQAKYRL